MAYSVPSFTTAARQMLPCEGILYRGLARGVRDAGQGKMIDRMSEIKTSWFQMSGSAELCVIQKSQIPLVPPWRSTMGCQKKCQGPLLCTCSFVAKYERQQQ